MTDDAAVREVFERPPNELAWRRWLATLDPWTRAAYEQRWAELTDEERDAAVRWAEVKLWRRQQRPQAS